MAAMHLLSVPKVSKIAGARQNIETDLCAQWKLRVFLHCPHEEGLGS